MAFSKITLTIRDDQKKALADHPEINVSGELQNALDKRLGLKPSEEIK